MKKMLAIKKRFLSLVLALIAIFAIIPSNQVHAEEQYYGGLEFAWDNLPVYSSTSWTNRIGMIYKYESFTVLLQNGPSGYLWVEYSTSNGAKRGYVQVPIDEWGGRKDGLARVIISSNIYYGPTNHDNYQTAGSVSVGETVVIIAKNDEWVYVEYNTNSGRKRGYMLYSNLSVYNRPGSFNDLYTAGKYTDDYIDGQFTVYSGPTPLYTEVGTVKNEKVRAYKPTITVYGDYTSQYIVYNVTGTNQLKSGFIIY